MKRVLVHWALAMGIWAGGGMPSSAVLPPANQPLPNFDTRWQRLSPEAAEMSAEKAYAVRRLQARMPGLRVDADRLLATPSYVASPHGFLTESHGAADDPHRSLKTFLREQAELFGYGPEILDGARIKTDYVSPHNGMRTTVWEQQVGGISVFESVLVSHITRDGQLVNLTTHLIPNLAQVASVSVPNYQEVLAQPPVSARQAVVEAARNLGSSLNANQVIPTKDQVPAGAREQRFKAEPALKGEIIARPAWVPLSVSEARVAWEVFVVSRARPTELYQTLVDAQTGEVILRRYLTAHLSDATYNVWVSDSPSPFSPGHATPSGVQPATIGRTRVTLSAVNTNTSPNGWIDDNVDVTMGNNVIAHTDWNDDDQPELPRPTATNRVFDFALDLTQTPTNYAQASVVQLFYWLNWAHDKFYELGFTEAAGNYQQFNFGRGGMDVDPVMADCQEGATNNNAAYRNNAYWMPAPDGYSPRIGMFIWDGPSPERDGSLDAEIVLHEATHGLSMRLVGAGNGMFQSQSRGLGEGWSDFYPLALLSEQSDNLNGNYAAAAYASYQMTMMPGVPPANDQNYYFGLRRYPYSTDMTKNPLTFKDIDSTQADLHAGVPMSPIWSGYVPFMSDEEHFQGEVWAVTLWEARANLIRKYGFVAGNRQILQLVTDGMKLCPPNPNFLQARDAIILADLVNNGGANRQELWRAFAKRGMGSSASSPPSNTTQGVEEAFDMPGMAVVDAYAVESITSNGNGAIDVNECNEINIVLVNNSQTNQTGINTILSSLTPGVVVTQGRSPYPDTLPGAEATNQIPFRIYTQPDFVCGTPIRLELVIRTTQDTRTNIVRLESGSIGAPFRFDNNIAMPIPDFPASALESIINVAGMSNPVGRVTVSLHLTHTFDADLDIQLIGPDGTAVALSKNNGLRGTNFGLACFPEVYRTTFDDKASQAIKTAQAPFVGSFQPDEPLSRFNLKSGFEVNGAWRLQITDMGSNDVGVLQCWSLNLFPQLCSEGFGQCPADLAVVTKVTPPLPVAGSNLTIQVTVTNQGPNDAFNVLLTSFYPTNMAYLGAYSTRGTCTNLGDRILCDVGDVANGSAVTLNILMRPGVAGLYTNFATTLSSVPDANPLNNEQAYAFSVRPASPLIVAAGANLIAESYSPPSGALEIGEAVTIGLKLRNDGAYTANNLVATLQNTGGVMDPSGPQVYGRMPAGGPPVERVFSFVAQGTNGGGVVATLRLQDGSRDLGIVTFSFGLSSEIVYRHPGSLALPEMGPAALYPAPIFVSGLFGQIKKVTVTLHELNHSFPDDLDILLVGPTGQGVMLMSDVGGGTDIQGVTLSFDDAGNPLPDENVLVSGTYRPTGYEDGDVFLSPAPAGPYATTLNTFAGADPNGLWSLYILDDQRGDGGRLNAGWTLQFTLFDQVNLTADLRASVTCDPRTVNMGGRVVYHVTVENRGPDEATGVMVTNTLPAGLANVAFGSSQGACEIIDGKVVCDLGSLTNVATVTIAGTATVSGNATCTASVFGAENDSNLANNVASGVAQVNPLADLALSFAPGAEAVVRGQPFTYQLVVTNLGPDAASGIVITNQLPDAVEFLNATSGQGSCAYDNGIISCQIPNLPKASLAVVSVTVRAPNRVTAMTNAAGVSLTAPVETTQANNAATLVTSVNDPDVIVVSAGSTITSEHPPYTGGIEPGEEVTLYLALRNIGVADTKSLRATLRNSQDLAGSTEPRIYGAVLAGGASVSRPFTIKVGGVSGQTVYATLDLSDETNELGTVSFPLILGGMQRTFASQESTLLPDYSPAQKFPLTIPVSGLTGAVGRVVVTLSGLSHGYPDDLDILVVSPQGQGVMMMSDAGGSQAISNIDLIFDDIATESLPNNLPLQSGVFKPTNFLVDDLFGAPAPAGPYGAMLGSFTGTIPNGNWSLYVMDDTLGDAGSLQGWSLDITTVGLINFPGPRLEKIQVANGLVRFRMSGRAGDQCTIEASHDLIEWTPVGSYTLGAQPAEVSEAVDGSNVRRFYRAVRKP